MLFAQLSLAWLIAYAKDMTDDDQAQELRFAIMRITRRLRAEKADDAMSDGQFSALRQLEETSPQSLSELAERERVTAPSMHRTVSALEAGGYLTRSGSAIDGRKVEISITRAGLDSVRETRRRRDEWFAQRLALLTHKQRSVLESAAPILASIAES
jgi:DNA-binding MarR family transcriptional regulator